MPPYKKLSAMGVETSFAASDYLVKVKAAGAGDVLVTLQNLITAITGTFGGSDVTMWIPGSSTWTYASATTMTVPAADAAIMRVGTKIKLTQTTAKYFYVTGISGTTITITGGTDYTLANATITSPYLSNQETPPGFPAEFNYTPTLTNLSGGTITTAKFTMKGGLVFVRFLYTLAGTNVSGSVRFTLPVSSAVTTSANAINSFAYLTDTGAATYAGIVEAFSATTVTVLVSNVSATYEGFSVLSSSVPFSWGNTDVISCAFTYPAA